MPTRERLILDIEEILLINISIKTESHICFYPYIGHTMRGHNREQKKNRRES